MTFLGVDGYFMLGKVYKVNVSMGKVKLNNNKKKILGTEALIVHRDLTVEMCIFNRKYLLELILLLKNNYWHSVLVKL